MRKRGNKDKGCNRSPKGKRQQNRLGLQGHTLPVVYALTVCYQRLLEERSQLQQQNKLMFPSLTIVNPSHLKEQCI